TGEPLIAGQPGGRSVWYSWQAPTNGNVTFHTTGSSFDTLLGVYTGNSVSTTTSVAANDDDATRGELTSRVTFNAVAGTKYDIVVDGLNGRTGQLNLSWNMGLSISGRVVARDSRIITANGNDGISRVTVILSGDESRSV